MFKKENCMNFFKFCKLNQKFLKLVYDFWKDIKFIYLVSMRVNKNKNAAYGNKNEFLYFHNVLLCFHQTSFINFYFLLNILYY